MGTSYEGIMVAAIGEFGFSQFLILLTAKLSTLIVAWALVMTSLIGTEPKWWKETTVFNATSNATFIKRLYKVCPGPGNRSGIIVFDDSIHTIVSEWSLVCGKEWIPRTILTIQMIGLLAGAAIVGQLSDWFGRKRSLLGVYVIVLVAVLAEGFSINWYMMACSAFFIGFSVGGFLVSCNLFLEFVGTKWRTITSVFPAWSFGLMLLGVAFKYLPSWRNVCHANVAVGFPVLLLYIFCPESARWLFVHGRIDEAKQVLDTLAHRNKLPPPDFCAIDTVLREDIAVEKHRKKKYNYFTLVSSKYTRWRIMVFGFIWFVMAFGYYTITFSVSKLDGDVSINMVLQGGMEILASISTVLISKYSGRRWATFFLMMLTSLSLFGITITFSVADSRTFRQVKAVLSLLSKFFLSSAWDNVMLFTLECFPTVIRNSAYGLSSVFTRVGGILAPQNIALYNISPHLPFTFTGTLFVIGAVLCLLLSDTYSKHLQDHFEQDARSGSSMGEENTCAINEDIIITIIATADLSKQQLSISRAKVDPVKGEQTWPTEEDLKEADN